jgi:hypothetical protein
MGMAICQPLRSEAVEGWAFVYMFVVLKIPVVAALWLVWWAIRDAPTGTEDPAVDGGGGGGGTPHPRRPRPRRPGRGEHGRPLPRAPLRTRARARPLTPAAHR